MYDQETIEIDKLVYLALHHRAIPIFVKRDIVAENHNKIIYLTEVKVSSCEFSKILEKVNKIISDFS